MNAKVQEIYQLLDHSPISACDTAQSEIERAVTQEEKDFFRWPLGYALIALKKYEEAYQIWSEIFERTRDHKALHQMGMTERESGCPDKALQIYQTEQKLISPSDIFSKAVNLYELSLCHLLLKDWEKAHHFFIQYKQIFFPVDSEDPIERGCFYRLKGDLFKSIDPGRAKDSYHKSLKYFELAQDSIASQEIKDRLSSLHLPD